MYIKIGRTYIVIVRFFMGCYKDDCNKMKCRFYYVI